MLGRDRGVLVGLELAEPLAHRAATVDLDAESQPQPRAGLVDQVDRLVGQHAVGEVAVGQLDGGASASSV